MALHRIEDLRALLATAPDGPERESLRRAWRDGSLLAWLETRAIHFGQPDPELLQRIQALAKRLATDADLGLFALHRTLDPRWPLALTADLSIPMPGDLESVFAAHPRRRRELLDALMQRLADGRLIEWIRAAGFAKSEAWIERLGRLPSRSLEGLETLPAYAVRWLFAPGAPFPTLDREVDGPAALAAWIDSGEAYRMLGLHLLDSGWLDLWLLTSGRLSDPAGLDVLRAADGSPRARLEMLLRLLDPARPSARIKVAPADLNLDRLALDTLTERALTITTEGPGYVWGACALEGQPSGIRIDPLSFDGTPARLNLTIDTRGVPPSTRCSANLVISAYDGGARQVLRVPIGYRVHVPLAEKIARSLVAGLTFGAAMMLLRALADTAMSRSTSNPRILEWVSMEWVGQVLDRSFDDFVGLVLLAFALLGALAGAGAFLARVRRR
ncbi:hypothetical protein THIOKS1810008 [Thiocapsa sp. KS1]|nr:hypothetical protein [Thiocapsa sp. KS1]CRI67790.1 hypothetical protein THIOKS1810008 [Thiocapsa sp. KS1]